MNTMSYKGYAAKIEYSDEDQCFVGHIAGIQDIVGFHGESVAELREAFVEAVDDYLEMCARLNRAPQKPYSVLLPRIKSVRYLQDYWLELGFTDGVKAKMDFAPQVLDRGDVFAPFQDVNFFRQVTVDEEAGTLVWPNGVDLDPDVLYSEATGTPLPEMVVA